MVEPDEKIELLPNLEYSQWVFLLKQTNEEIISNQEKQEIKKKLINVISEENMLPFYLYLCEELKWEKDLTLIEKMKKINEEKLKQLEETYKDAVENLGESEIRDALQAKADYFTRIGDKEKAENQYRLTIEKTIGSGKKLDIVFTLIRLGLFWGDHNIINSNLEKARNMIETGSDWDRRNRLKVYEGLYLITIRNFKRAANLLLETISTFTAIELTDYQTFIFYTLLSAIISLDRVSLKEKVINAPEILQVVDNFPYLRDLMNSIYFCDYAKAFVSLAELTEVFKRNRFLAPHCGYYCKELRILIYSQMLESYKSVQLESMANTFGVSVDFLDRELSRFIASGRLHCKIDKVGGIVETNRLDSKNSQYQDTIKQGDLLLNRIQKLSRVINL
jgi:26S proteasome regulatory subunit N7